MDRSRIAVIIPAFNEEGTIGNVVRNSLPYGTPIVVDDASTDKTADEAKHAGAIVIGHDSNLGYDAVLNSGFQEATRHHFEYAVTIDADGQHNPELISKFVAQLSNKADVVIGIRPYHARISEKVFSMVTRLLYGIKDPLCGMKGYRLSLYRTAGHFDSYGSIGTELTLFAAKNKYEIAQIPITISKREGSPRFGKSFTANRNIMKALFLSFSRVKHKKYF